MFRKCDHGVHIPDSDPDLKSMYCSGCTPPYIANQGRFISLNFHRQEQFDALLLGVTN